MEYTKEQIKEQLDNLPEDLRKAIIETDIEQTIFSIGERFKLPIDKRGELFYQTQIFMIGFTRSDQFVKSLTQSLNIDADIAGNIALAVNDQIMVPIRQTLKAEINDTGNLPLVPKKKFTDEEIDKLLEDTEKLLNEDEEEPKEVNPFLVVQKESEPSPIAEKKLTETVTLTPEVTDHSLSREDIQKVDPYREPTN
jgi:hypothetical protein